MHRPPAAPIPRSTSWFRILAFLLAAPFPSFAAPVCHETGIHDPSPAFLQFVPVDQWVANAFSASPCASVLSEVGFYYGSSGGTVELAVYDGLNLVFSGIFSVPAGSGWLTVGTPPIPVSCPGDFILAVRPLSPGFSIGRANPVACRSDSDSLGTLMPPLFPDSAILTAPPNGPCYETYLKTCDLPTPTITLTFTPGPTETPTDTPGTPTETFTPGPTDTVTLTPTPLGPTDTPTETPTITSTPGICEDRYWPGHSLVLGTIAPGFLAAFDQMCFKAWMTSDCGAIIPTFTVVDQNGDPVSPSFTLSGPATVDVCLPFIGAYAAAGPLWWLQAPLCGGFDMSDFRLRNDCMGSPTPTSSATRTSSPTFTFTPTWTRTLTFTATPSPTRTWTITSTATPSGTSTPTATPTSTITFSPTVTDTSTQTSTLTVTSTGTVTPTVTDTPGPYTVALGVYNEAGERIKELVVRSSVEPCSALDLAPSGFIGRFQGPGSSVSIACGSLDLGSWDGTNEQGDPVSNGTYFLKVETLDAFGAATGVTRTVLVQRRNARREVRVLNSAGEIVRRLYVWMGDPMEESLTDLSLSAGVFQPGGPGGDLGIVLTTTANPVTLAWDGRTEGGARAAPGHYLITIHWEDGQGASQDMNQGVVLTGNNEEWDVVAQPNFLWPGSGVDTAAFSAVSPGNWTLRVTIFTLAGEKVAEMTGGVGSNVAYWNASEVASGLYLTVVEARNSVGGSHRKTLKVLVLR